MTNPSSDSRYVAPGLRGLTVNDAGPQREWSRATDLAMGRYLLRRYRCFRQLPMRICRRGQLFAEAVFFLEDDMPKKHSTNPLLTGRIGWSNGSQTVGLPPGFRFADSVREVFIRRDGERLVLIPRPTDWSSFFASGVKTSADFMALRERLPIQERVV
ncbi:antitoxin [Acidovorax sp. sic0104]|uniref:antitoxin n=1 Tax=Acidovorax sp. sic0104 TaxID=2854784 RepID=UPI001C4745A3|nr:hypothetical protein [Acidovorax sp. sic0104]MBV7543498.1 hypothetical protein [Acidovorax sp. sic0104]